MLAECKFARTGLKHYSVVFQHPVQFTVDLQGDEADADVCLDPVLVEVEYRAYLQLGLRDPERLLHVVELVVSTDNCRRRELGYHKLNAVLLRYSNKYQQTHLIKTDLSIKNNLLSHIYHRSLSQNKYRLP